MFIKQLPISIRGSHKSDVRSQFSALCYRIVRNKPQILLITSRKTGRWIVPKGWPVDGLTPAQSALREAWEEAGVIGKQHDRCLGLYSYKKSSCSLGGVPCVAMVFPVLVKSLSRDFPEKNQRRRKWCAPKKAAAKVCEPELARILRDFDPRILH
ncbi:NUDIX hydrolase [Sedimentitalea nanhaiensis]|uniref:8-oxo-dGTP pyrophosphatase MutT, NUDIX family n=1 Tax=Sedimentitalea nanhaiensis TaxID=999627 RepID=A0A1I6ZKF6_9RHOB|nr:NUDIX hydrolase [Sedimentitalea nanhaiensis]SFT63143.1 8-oxo-dGTP pyrophosphatase MutT, NUDIX family [Sedimentitalea nanhaiensis]